MLFRLGNGPGGQDIFWTVAFDDTISFSLSEHVSPDVVLVGDWRTMMAAVQAGRDGNPTSPELHLQGEPELFEELNGIFDLARPMATLETVLPSV